MAASVSANQGRAHEEGFVRRAGAGASDSILLLVSRPRLIANIDFGPGLAASRSK